MPSFMGNKYLLKFPNCLVNLKKLFYVIWIKSQHARYLITYLAPEMLAECGYLACTLLYQGAGTLQTTILHGQSEN